MEAMNFLKLEFLQHPKMWASGCWQWIEYSLNLYLLRYLVCIAFNKKEHLYKNRFLVTILIIFCRWWGIVDSSVTFHTVVHVIYLKLIKPNWSSLTLWNSEVSFVLKRIKMYHMQRCTLDCVKHLTTKS